MPAQHAACSHPLPPPTQQDGSGNLGEQGYEGFGQGGAGGPGGPPGAPTDKGKPKALVATLDGCMVLAFKNGAVEKFTELGK